MRDFMMDVNHSYLLWIGVFVFAVHMVEAFFFDFAPWIKKALHIPSITWNHFFVVNTFAALTGISCAMVGWMAPTFSLLFAAMLILGGLFHVVMTLVRRHMMPGLYSAVLLWIPVGVCTYFGASWDGVLTTQAAILSFLWAILILPLPYTFAKLSGKK